MTLSDTHYRIAALFNLGISLPHLPPDCQGCGGKNLVAIDPYHYLSCNAHKRKEITIGHNMVVHVLYKYNHLTGGAGVMEPKDLHGSDGRCPDLQMVSNNEHIITDVQITNPLCPSNQKGAARKQLFAAEKGERTKSNKYDLTAQQHHATFIPFIMEATGGMSESAQQIYSNIILASRDSATSSPHDIIARELRGSIAIAIQRRNAMTMIAGRCLAIGRAATCAAA